MGFRCPICQEDFGRDKEKFDEHCKEAHYGAAKIAVDAIVNAVEESDE